MNYAKTAALLAGMTALFMGVGWLLGGMGGALIALVIACGMNFYAWWGSADAILKRHNAQIVTRQSAPELFDMVERLARNADMPTPKIYIINDDAPNAFATGRGPENGAVAATTGIMRTLSTEELAGVMAHELAHIQNRDTLIMTVAATIGGAISMLAQFSMFFRGNRGPLGFVGVLIAAMVAPMAASVVQMMISRTREYAADRRGAEICGNPLWLASALASISGRGAVRTAERNPASAHMFIINPLSGGGLNSLFSTHPPMDKRIAALEEMAGQSLSRASAGGPWR